MYSALAFACFFSSEFLVADMCSINSLVPTLGVCLVKLALMGCPTSSSTTFHTTCIL